MKRSDEAIKISLLKLLRNNPINSYAKLAILMKTGFRTVKRNCEGLEQYKLIKIEKIPKEKSPSKKESFRISITGEGLEFLKRVEEK